MQQQTRHNFSANYPTSVGTLVVSAWPMIDTRNPETSRGGRQV